MRTIQDSLTTPATRARCGYAALVVLTWLAHMVLPSERIWRDLDRSWCAGLAYAALHRWQAGVDYVFSYGPLGFLSTGAYVRESFWTQFLLWACLFHGLVAIVLVAAGARIESRGIRWSYFALAVLLPFDTDSLAFLSMAAILSCAGGTKPGRGRLIAIGIVVLSVYSLVKFSFLVAATLCTASVVATVWGSASRRAGALTMAGAVVLLAGLWMACGQSLANVPEYLLRSLQLAGGYTESMSRPSPQGPITVAVVLVGLMAGLALAGTASRPRSIHRIATATAQIALILVAFKASFVRGEEHLPIFFLFASAASLLLVATHGTGPSWTSPWTVGGLGGAALGVLGAFLAAEGSAEVGLGPARAVLAHVQALVRPAAFRDEAEARFVELESLCSLPRTRQIVGADTIDVLSWGQIMVLWNGLNWRPRPVFQGYATFTPELMELNARFLESDQAPHFVLVYLQSIDQRFPTMDDAAALQVIARDYVPMVQEKGFLLMHREPRRGAREGSRTDWRRDAVLGERLDLGKLSGASHLLRLDVRKLTFGRLRSWLFTMPPLFFEVELSNGEKVTGRIVPSMVRNGMLIDPLLRSQDDWVAWRTHGAVLRPVAVRVLAPESTGIYDERIGVELVSVDDLGPR